MADETNILMAKYTKSHLLLCFIRTATCSSTKIESQLHKAEYLGALQQFANKILFKFDILCFCNIGLFLN